MHKEHMAQVLTSIPMFSDLDKDELNDIIRIATTVEFQAGETVCNQDDPGDSMYIVATGRADVSIRNKDGMFVPVAKLGPGELFGELALIDAQPRSARVVSKTRLEALKLDRRDFIKLKDQLNPATYKIMKRIVRTVCGRLRSTNISIINAINPASPELAPDPPSARPQTFWRGLLQKVRGGHE
jgi:CRP/FNR family transcriptional regulator, cyclic AMP receptor protein